MPLPKPSEKEKQTDFISRCMGDKEINKNFSDQKQKAAVCFSIWKKSKQKKTNGSDELDFIIVE